MNVNAPVWMVQLWMVILVEESMSMPSVLGDVAGAIMWRFEIFALLQPDIDRWNFWLFMCFNPLISKLLQPPNNIAWAILISSITIILTWVELELATRNFQSWDRVRVFKSMQLIKFGLTAGALLAWKKRIC